MKRNKVFLVTITIIGCAGLLLWSWGSSFSIATGQSVYAEQSPYHQLTYDKLSSDHGGKFTGDVYLLNLETGESTQLTQGGTTTNASWLNREKLLIRHRPRTSVVDLYELDVNSGLLSTTDGMLASLLWDREIADAYLHSNPKYSAIRLHPTDIDQGDRYAILQTEADEAKIITTIDSVGPYPLKSVPGSDLLVFNRQDGQICLLDLRNLNEVCRAGVQHAVSHSVEPKLIAFVEKVDTGYQLCTAEIETVAFKNVQCHDHSQQQIINLAWRP